MASLDKVADNHVEQIAESVHSIDDKQKGADIDNARQLAQQYVPGSPEEKALLRKLDWRLIVCTAIPIVTLLTSSSHVSGFSTCLVFLIAPTSGMVVCYPSYTFN